MTTAVDEFVAHRPMLGGLAYRMLGSWQDAQDVLQEAYLRWAGVDRAEVEQPRRYLTRVVTRLCLDALRARRREAYVGPWLPEPVSLAPGPFEAGDPADLSVAVLHLMERLSPPQRAVYVLRTAFELPYAEIGQILDRAEEDCRQLYRRAAAAVHAGRPRFAPSRQEHRRLLEEFVAAARGGDLDRLHRLLHADAVAWTDGGGRSRAARRPVVGGGKVARFFSGIYTRRAWVRFDPVDLNGRPGLLVTTPSTRHTLSLEVDAGRIVGVYVTANPDKLGALG